MLLVRDQRLAAGRAALAARRASGFSVEEAVRLLADRGLDEQQVRDGSMPQDSLDYLTTFLVSELPAGRPLLGLHIGNFVGVSLAWLGDALRTSDAGSRVLSIDPDIAHRGIDQPSAHAFAVLAHFDLLSHNLVLSGYTLEQNVGDDHLEPVERFEAEQRPERVLPSLAELIGPRFDIVLIDGNHDGRYLARELEQVGRLLAPAGLLVVDDVDERNWQAVHDTFARVAEGEAFEELGRAGRVGVL
ncbi:MAG: class I SAM-dependent methyltransferase, partial [Actinomycetota bacterium]|nr:class I SAM-dependent methyltransferase [Actinomycetota bacterium]